MDKIARINLHLEEDVITINAQYALHIGIEESSENRLSFCQLRFKAEFWQERRAFPDHGLLLERAVLGRQIRAISFVDMTGRLSYYDIPFVTNTFGGNRLQTSAMDDSDNLIVMIGENL